MRIVLDTHILLWVLADSEELPPAARRFCTEGLHDIYVSAVSIWEIALKHSLGKLDLSAQTVRDNALESGFLPLNFTLAHAIAVDQLPYHHRDPFDRALIAQAQCEPFYLLTHDAVLASYGDVVLQV